MPFSVFLSTVSDEFRPDRDQLCGDLTRRNVVVKVQEVTTTSAPALTSARG